MNNLEKNNQIIMYNTEDGQMKIEVRMKDETVWLSQKQMAELFDCTVDNISLHLKNVFREAELSENSVVEEYSITATDGKNYDVKHYNLDAIISIGYRINSLRGTQFRIWATQKLKEYIIKGFVMDDERLAEGRVQRTYFEEWEERIRRDVFAISADYNPRTDYAKLFFATVQNKFHFAITGLTATEIVHSRADSQKEHMGLTNWKGEIITRDQAQVAKIIYTPSL